MRVGATVAALGSLLARILGVSRTTLAMASWPYAIANAAAFTLTPAEGRLPRTVPVLAGCAVLAFALPLNSVISGAAVLAVGAAVYGVRKARARS